MGMTLHTLRLAVEKFPSSQLRGCERCVVFGDEPIEWRVAEKQRTFVGSDRFGDSFEVVTVRVNIS